MNEKVDVNGCLRLLSTSVDLANLPSESHRNLASASFAPTPIVHIASFALILVLSPGTTAVLTSVYSKFFVEILSINLRFEPI